MRNIFDLNDLLTYKERCPLLAKFKIGTPTRNTCIVTRMDFVGRELDIRDGDKSYSVEFSEVDIFMGGEGNGNADN